jgi:hypothetical protein
VIRIVFELAVLLGIVAGVLYLARQFDRQRGGGRILEPPPEAMWRAVHHGTPDERTEVQILLRSGPNEIWDRRTCATIENANPDYDRLLFNALEDAKARADLLNRMREPQ